MPCVSRISDSAAAKKPQRTTPDPGEAEGVAPLGTPCRYDALDAAGLPRMRFHDLRHTFGTLAVQAFPLIDVKAFMVNADIQTTMIYAHHVPEHDAADRSDRPPRRSRSTHS